MDAMHRFRILLLLLIITGAVIFALRHQSLRQLQAEQDLLMHATPDASNPPPAIVPAPAPEVSTNTGLSADERSELLRLRGQIGGLRQELAQTTNQLAKLAKTPRPRPAAPANPDEPIITREEMVQKMSRGKQWMVALLIYSADHNDRLPGTLEAADQPQSPIGSLDEFEYLLGETNINSIRSPATTIALREKKSWKTENGRWNRTYAFADGHVENAVSDSNDFTDWEARHQPSDNPPAQ